MCSCSSPWCITSLVGVFNFLAASSFQLAALKCMQGQGVGALFRGGSAGSPSAWHTLCHRWVAEARPRHPAPVCTQ